LNDSGVTLQDLLLRRLWDLLRNQDFKDGSELTERL